MDSVSRWAARQGFGYEFVDDQLFSELSDGERRKLAGRLPIQADIGRLLLLERHLAHRGGIALWIDADTFCLDADWRPTLDRPAGVGQECWVQPDQQGRWRCFYTPHNGFMLFHAGDPVLPFLRHTARSMIERVQADAIAPQMIGPKLLKALHSLAPFALYPEAGALSPALRHELVTELGPAVNCYRHGRGGRPAMLNLCASLVREPADISEIEQLLAQPERFLALG